MYRPHAYVRWAPYSINFMHMYFTSHYINASHDLRPLDLSKIVVWYVTTF